MGQFADFLMQNWLLVAALVFFLVMLINSFAKSGNQVSPQQAVQKMNHEDAIYVDVRESHEFKEGHAPDARHLPLGQVADKAEAQLGDYKDKPVIVGCQSGNRSARACSILRKQGFNQVYNLRGGIMAWKSDGLPVTKS